MQSKYREQEIIDGCIGGNRKAQRDLYEAYSRAMFNVCLRILNQEGDAEDVLQNSFVDVFTKMHTFRGDSTIGAWIKRIVINNCINHLNRRKVRFEELGEHWDQVDLEPDSLELESNSQVNVIRKCIQQLPDGYRTVFSLYLLEGYDHKEIAEILGINESTSKTQYSRAKQKIRQMLKSDSTEIKSYGRR